MVYGLIEITGFIGFLPFLSFAYEAKLLVLDSLGRVTLEIVTSFQKSLFGSWGFGAFFLCYGRVKREAKR